MTTNALSATAGGHEDAVPRSMSFDAFFEARHGELFSALCLITRNRHEAEEIMQDAFLSLLERWDRVSSMDDPTGYLYRTSMNAFRKRHRRAKLATKRAIGMTPRDDDLEEVEAREAVVRALAPLTPAQRAAIVLTDLLDFTSEEAAELLGTTAGAVRTLASRGRAALRQITSEGDA
jgi:RNA polymerase sigma factor (sigma-70 family)